MKWSWSPLSYQERVAAIARFRDIAAERIAVKEAPPPPLPRARGRRSEPHAVVLGAMDVLYVVHTLDVVLAVELMTEYLDGLGVDTEDVKVILSEPVALNPWIVETDRARRLEGVLFRC